MVRPFRAGKASIRELAEDRFFPLIPAGLTKVMEGCLFLVSHRLMPIAKNSRINFVQQIVFSLSERLFQFVEFCLRIQEKLLAHQKAALERRYFPVKF